MSPKSRLMAVSAVRRVTKGHPHLRANLIRTRNILLRFPSKRRWSTLSDVADLCLNLGSGPSKGTGPWINVDESGSDINWDLRRGIPVEDCAVSEVYSSHFLEHLEAVDLQNLVREIVRVLRPGGYFMISVPDARKFVEAYLAGRDLEDRSGWFKCDYLVTGTSIDQLNYVAYLGGQHRQLFDYDGLREFLLQSGFSQVERREPNDELDLPSRTRQSLLIGATK